MCNKAKTACCCKCKCTPELQEAVLFHVKNIVYGPKIEPSHKWLGVTNDLSVALKYKDANDGYRTHTFSVRTATEIVVTRGYIDQFGNLYHHYSKALVTSVLDGSGVWPHYQSE